MANILTTPNSQDQTSDVVAVATEETFQFTGAFPFGSALQGEVRKTGSSEDFVPVAEYYITAPGPLNVVINAMDVRFTVVHYDAAMAVDVEY